MDDCELITLISTIACGITKYCSEDDISIMAVAFNQLGDTLSTYLVQKSIREKRIKEKETKNKDETSSK